MNRYLIVQEPSCTWAVFDSLSDAPAELGSRITIGLTKREAMELAARANRLAGANVFGIPRAA